MATVKEQMLKARSLIEKKQYDKARAILKDVDHPKAKEWLKKLDTIAPAPKKGGKAPSAKSGRRSGRSGLATLLSVLILIVVVAAAFFVFNNMNNKTNTGANVVSAAADVLAQNDSLDIPLIELLPQDTVLYASMRTGDDYIAELDALWSKIDLKSLAPEIGAAPEDIPANVTSMLDLLTLSQFSGNYESTIGAWLGDQVVLGLSGEGEDVGSEGLIIARVTDKDAALTFFNQNVFLENPWTESTEGDFTVYTAAEGEEGALALGSDVLYYASSRELLPLSGAVSPNLSENTSFLNTMRRLPAPSYNILVYMNTFSFMQNQVGSEFAGIDLNSTGAMAVGATVLDGKALVLDLAQETGDLLTEVAGATGVNLASVGTIDRGFMRYVPANASMVIHGTNLKGIYDSTLNAVRAASTQNPELDAASIDEGLTQLEAQVQQFTGLSLQNDILSWLTGDYAFFASYTALEPGSPSILTTMMMPSDEAPALGFDAGWVIEATDSAKAKTVVDSLNTLLNQMGPSLGATVSREDMGGANAVVVSVPAGVAPMPIELVIGANDNVFVIGTRGAATAALSEGGFDQSAGYQTASQYLLPGAVLDGYLGSSGFVALGDSLLMTQSAVDQVFADVVGGLGTEVPETSDSEMPSNMEIQTAVRAFAARFNGAHISSAVTDDNNTIARFVIVLAD